MCAHDPVYWDIHFLAFLPVDGLSLHTHAFVFALWYWNWNAANFIHFASQEWLYRDSHQRAVEGRRTRVSAFLLIPARSPGIALHPRWWRWVPEAGSRGPLPSTALRGSSSPKWCCLPREPYRLPFSRSFLIEVLILGSVSLLPCFSGSRSYNFLQEVFLCLSQCFTFFPPAILYIP